MYKRTPNLGLFWPTLTKVGYFVMNLCFFWCTKVDKYQVSKRFDKFHVCLDIMSERNAGIHREAVCCWIPDSNWICVNAICRCILSPHCTKNLLLLLFLSLITNHYSYLYHHGSHLKRTHIISLSFLCFSPLFLSLSHWLCICVCLWHFPRR